MLANKKFKIAQNATPRKVDFATTGGINTKDVRLTLSYPSNGFHKYLNVTMDISEARDLIARLTRSINVAEGK